MPFSFQFGWNEEVYDQAAVFSFVVNSLGILGVVFDTASHAAGEGIEGATEVFARPHAERDEVAHHPIVGILGSQDMVVERTLVVVRIGSLRVPRIQEPCQLEHVIRIASFAGIVAEPVVELVGLAEVFVVAVAANHIGVVTHHRIPKKVGNLLVAVARG
jgi:hypothetical protein